MERLLPYVGAPFGFVGRRAPGPASWKATGLTKFRPSTGWCLLELSQLAPEIAPVGTDPAIWGLSLRLVGSQSPTGGRRQASWRLRRALRAVQVGVDANGSMALCGRPEHESPRFIFEPLSAASGQVFGAGNGRVVPLTGGRWPPNAQLRVFSTAHYMRCVSARAPREGLRQALRCANVTMRLKVFPTAFVQEGRSLCREIPRCGGPIGGRPLATCSICVMPWRQGAEKRFPSWMRRPGEALDLGLPPFNNRPRHPRASQLPFPDDSHPGMGAVAGALDRDELFAARAGITHDQIDLVQTLRRPIRLMKAWIAARGTWVFSVRKGARGPDFVRPAIRSRMRAGFSRIEYFGAASFSVGTGPVAAGGAFLGPDRRPCGQVHRRPPTWVRRKCPGRAPRRRWWRWVRAWIQLTTGGPVFLVLPFSPGGTGRVTEGRCPLRSVRNPVLPASVAGWLAAIRNGRSRRKRWV